MGADDDASRRVPFINPAGHADVRRVTEAALAWLNEVPQQAGAMTDFIAENSEVAHEMLAWSTIAMLRLETKGLLPPSPRHPPV